MDHAGDAGDRITIRADPRLLTAHDLAKALAGVVLERAAQDAEWGRQDHGYGTWRQILDEEVGEAAKEELGLQFGSPREDQVRSEFEHMMLERIRAEWVQIAAVAVACVESTDRKIRALPAPGTACGVCGVPMPITESRTGKAGTVRRRVCPKCGRSKE